MLFTPISAVILFFYNKCMTVIKGIVKHLPIATVLAFIGVDIACCFEIRRPQTTLGHMMQLLKTTGTDTVVHGKLKRQ